MAQIPVPVATPTFGSAVAQPAQAANPANLDVSSGAMGVLNSVESALNEHARQQDNVKATLAMATSLNAMRDAHLQVTQGLQDGSISPGDAHTELQSRFDTISTVNGDGLKEHQLAGLKAAMLSTGGELQRQLAGNVLQYKQDTTKADQDELGRQLQLDARRRGPSAVADTYDAVMDTTGAAAGYNPEQIAAKKAAFRSQTTAGYYLNKGFDLQQANNLSGLTDAIHEVAGAAGDQMGTMQKERVLTHLVGLQNQLLAGQRRQQNMADAEAQAKESDAVDVYNKAREVVFNGLYLSADAIADGSARTAGTQMAMPMRHLLTMQENAVNFASAPANQRAAMLEHYRAEAANPAVGTSPDGAKQLALMAQLDSRMRAAQVDNPWQAAQTYGLIVNAPAMPMSAESLPQTLDVRLQRIGRVEAWVGHRVSPLQPAEAQQLVEIMKGMPANQAATLLGAVGQSVGDPERIGEVAKQLGDKDGTYRLAMAYAGDRTETGKLTSEYILRGAQALRDKTSQVDNAVQSGWRATISKQIRGAFSSQQAEDDAIDAAFKITAARDSSGEASGDTSTAVRMATGGIITHGAADAKIPLPYGVDEKTFNQRLSSITPALLQSQAPDGKAYVNGVSMPLAKLVSDLPSATLVHAGQGQYVIRGGNTFVTNQAGQRIVLRITQ